MTEGDMADCGVPIEQHIADHEWIRECKEELMLYVEAQKRSRERWEKIRTQVIGGLILSAIGGVGTVLFWVGRIVLEHVEKVQP